VATDEDIAIDDQSGAIAFGDLGVLPRESELIVLGLDVNGDRFSSFESTTTLSDGIVACTGQSVMLGRDCTVERTGPAAGPRKGLRRPVRATGVLS